MPENNLGAFEQVIRPYHYVWSGYENAIAAAREIQFEGKELDFFLSKSCRAYFFFHHLKVEREAADSETRDINKSPIVPFQLSDIQLKRLDDFEKRMMIGKKFRARVMKCRRARVSTIYLAISYHIVRFNENKKGLCFCDRLETSRKLRRILDIFYQSDDLQLKPVIGKKTLCEGLYLHPSAAPKGSTDRDSFILLGSGEQSNSGIGGSLDFMVWSEAALTKDAERHWTTISPSLQGALFDVAESTPSMSGQDAIIYPEFENKSENCDTEFISWLDVKEYTIDDDAKIAEFAPFMEHHLYGKEVEIMKEHSVSIPQMLWRRYKLDEIRNLNAFRQVFPISQDEAFYASAGLFFNKGLIDLVTPENDLNGVSHSFSDQGMDVSSMVDDSGPWKIYSSRSVESNYLISVDVAEGKCADKEMRNPDYSVAIVWKLSSPIQEVAIFRDRIPPEVLAEQVAAAGKYYNNAMVVPERNGAGLAFLVRLLQLYANIYRQHKLQSNTYVMTQEYGFQTTSTSKPHALSCLLSQIRETGKGLLVQSDLIRKEMAKFVQSGAKYGALPGFHDDTVTAMWLMAISVWQTPSMVRSREVLGGQPGGGMGNVSPLIPRDDWAMGD